MQFFFHFNNHLTLEIQILLIAVLALISGSFASLLSYRMIKNQPIIFARSRCGNCQTNLKIRNLIPLFSWIFQRGKCSNCHEKISVRYPLIELIFLVSFLTIFFALHQEISWRMIILFLITATMIIMCIVDLEEYFIPNSTQYFLAVLATILVLLDGGVPLVLINLKPAFLYMAFGICLYAFFYYVANIEALGIDDMKFFFVAGFMLGLKNFVIFMLLSGVFGLLFGSIWQKVKKEEAFPFAPAICLSTFLCLLFDKHFNPVDLLGSLLFF